MVKILLQSIPKKQNFIGPADCRQVRDKVRTKAAKLKSNDILEKLILSTETSTDVFSVSCKNIFQPLDSLLTEKTGHPFSNSALKHF